MSYKNNNNVINYSDYLSNLGSNKCCNLGSGGPIGPTGGNGAIGPVGSVGPTGYTGPTGADGAPAPSDLRDKMNVYTLEPGVDFIDRLKPVHFTWNMRKDENKRGMPDIGFIAQDLLQIQEDTGHKIPELVNDNDPEYLLANYSKLIPVYAKAIQELNAKIIGLENTVEILKNNPFYFNPNA